jgi:hypothetical protein
MTKPCGENFPEIVEEGSATSDASKVSPFSIVTTY